MCMLAISKSSLEKRLFRRPAQFLIVFFLCWWMIHCFKYHTVQYTEVCQLSQKHLYICPESIIAPSFLLSNSFPLSWASLVVQLVRNPPAVWGTCVGKIPWRRERLPTPVFWPGEFHGRYSPWGRKESTWLSDFHVHFPLSYSYRDQLLLFMILSLNYVSLDTVA